MSDLAYSCPDCGAAGGDECATGCPSAAVAYAAAVVDELAEPVCHPDVVSAAADGCYCHGTAGRALVPTSRKAAA
ncbi:hypothetical protein [Nocardioides sp. L-11A]|uniref:hypothetical protein n=1 Tax=Nocardioides sp. L-11A TaxID=3043848 RepID=UPI00249B3775|nr:hypothetical protein QJ852_10015 [Nocardioides sp. L-11A]